MRITAKTNLNLAFVNLLRMLQQEDYLGVEQAIAWMLSSEMLTFTQASGLRDAISAALDMVDAETGRKIRG